MSENSVKKTESKKSDSTRDSKQPQKKMNKTEFKPKDSNKDSIKKSRFEKKDSERREFKKSNQSDKKELRDSSKPKQEKEKTKFYMIDCIVCGENREVPFKPIEGVPSICFACKEELDAKRWLYSNFDELETTKKQVCKACNQTYYAPNEAYIICDDCYKKFSKLVYADQKDLVIFNCSECGKEDFFPKKYNDKNPSNLLCRECFLKKKS